MIDFRCESVEIYLTGGLEDVQTQLYLERMNSTGMTGFEPEAEAGVRRTKTYRPRAKNTRKKQVNDAQNVTTSCLTCDSFLTYFAPFPLSRSFYLVIISRENI